MNRKLSGLAATVAVLALAGCGSTSTAANTSTPSASSPAKLSPSAAATPTTVDPCQLVTQSEASQLAGTAYASSKEETTSGGSKICWYGAQTLNVFEVLVATFTSQAAAQSGWDQEKSEVEAELKKASSGGVTMTVNTSDTNLSGADRAAAGTFSGNLNGHTLAGTALYFLKGVHFVAIVDLVLDHTPPTVSAMEAQGQTAVGRLP